MRRTPSGANSTCTPSVAISALYCVGSEASGSVRMRTKSPTFSESSSTRIGNRPCSSGIRSEGLERLNAPEAMNSTWSVFTGPYLVATVEPSTSGSRSRCTPSRETSAPSVSWRRVTLSISSMNTMPFCSALASAWILSSSSLMSLPASSSVSCLSASRTFSLRVRVRLPPRFWNIDCSCCCISSMPGGAMIPPPIARMPTPIPVSRSRTSCSPTPLGRLLLARDFHGDVGEILDDRVDVAADVAELGELGGLHLHERRVGELRQAPGDLGLANAGRADHENVLGRDFLPQRLVDLHATPAVAQCDGHGALGGVLTDDMLVEFLDDLAGR